MESIPAIKLTRVTPKSQDVTLKKVESPSFEGTTPTERFIHRTGARAAEYALGAPGELANLGLSGLNYLIQKGTGQESPLPSKVPFLPTVAEAREKITEPIAEILTGQKGSEYLKAEGPIEEGIQEVLGAGLAGALSGGGSFLRSIGALTVGKLGGEAAKFFGGSPTTQALTNLGASTVASLYGGRGQVANTMNKHYDTARKAIPEGTKVNISNLRKTVNKAAKDLQGRDFKGKDFIKARVEAAEGLLQGKEPVEITKLMDLKKDLNSWYGSAYGENKKRLGELITSIKQPIEDYAKKNPDFGTNWKTAEQTFGALAESGKIGEFFNKYTKLKSLPKSPLVSAALSTIGSGIGYGLAKGAISVPNLQVAAVPLGSALIARELNKFFSLLSKSPQAQQVYGKMLKSAAAGNVVQATKNINQLDKVVSKSDTGEGKPIRLTRVS